MEKEKIIIFIEGYKFDVTDYIDKHPGGAKILKKFNERSYYMNCSVKITSKCYS